jgi:hypothetical protein
MDIVGKAPPGFNVMEFIKEAYSNMGYRDGSRFWNEKQDPRLMKAMQMIQQMQGMLQGKQMELQAGLQEKQLAITSNEKIKSAELQVDSQRISGDLRIRESETAIEAARLELERFLGVLEAQGLEQEHMMKLREMMGNIQQAQMKLQEQRIKNEGIVLKLSADLNREQARAGT